MAGRDLLAALILARDEIHDAVDNKPVGKLAVEVRLKDWHWWDCLLRDLIVYVQAQRDAQRRREEGDVRSR